VPAPGRWARAGCERRWGGGGAAWTGARGVAAAAAGRGQADQEELAEAAGVSPRSVSDLELGIHATARKDTARLLADALGLAEPVRAMFVAAAQVLAAVRDEVDIMSGPAGLHRPAAGFGATLRRFRVAAGLSQEGLAQGSGLSADAIAALEQGRRTRPRAFTVGVLADALRLGAADRALLVLAASGQSGPDESPGVPLPPRLTSFVGRQLELAEVGRRLGQARLLTLFGPGGTGKTALAVAVAERQPGARWFAALDACAEPALVVGAVATALGVREVAGTQLRDALLRHAAGMDGLLVMDNCEHVAAAVAELARDLLRISPRLRLLATSREVLRVPGEVTWQVPPLPEADAINLFAERAALAVPGFAIGPGNSRTVARVCQLLDGVPLAIELAAARSRVLTPAQLADRLDDAFTLLTSGPRTAVPRHQTLRAAVDWSYQLIDPEQRRLFRTLSVFAGGFDLAAAEAVWGGPALELLAGLADRSLVQAEPAGAAMRYRLLEVLRQYGQARLAENGEEDEARRRHAAHYLRLAQLIPPGIPTGADQRQWLPRCRAEHANFDAALRWAAGRADAARVELAHALVPFWVADGSISEGRIRVEAALAAARDTMRVRILDAAAWFAYLQGDYGSAVARAAESVELKRAAGAGRGLGRRLNLLGLYRIADGDVGAGQQLLEEALGIVTAEDDERGAAESTLLMGLTALARGDLTAAERYLRAAAGVQHTAGDPVWLVTSYGSLCLVLMETGNLAEARALAGEVFAAVSGPLSGMREEAGWLWGGMVAAELEGRDRAALRLLGAIQAWSQRGVRWLAPLCQRYQPVADRLRGRADPGMAAALMAEGAAMSPEELAAEAMATEDR